jgi:hypothetical protein
MIPGVMEEEAEVEIRDMMGRTVRLMILRTESNAAFQSRLETGELKPGVYLVSVRTGTGLHRAKMVIGC